MTSELKLSWEKHKPVIAAMTNVSSLVIGALSLLVSISESAKQAVATPLKAAAPWLAASIPYVLPLLYFAIAGLVIWLTYRTKVKQADEIQRLKQSLNRANEANHKQAQHQIDTEHLHREALDQQALNYSVQVESLKDEVNELKAELQCLCHGNLVADEVILLQESLEDFLQQSPEDQAESIPRTLKLIARSMQQVTRDSDGLLRGAFYLPSEASGVFTEIGWYHNEIKGNQRKALGKKAKAFAERYRDSRDRGFMPYSFGDEQNPEYYVGVQTLRTGDNLFAVFVVVARSEKALQSCDKILELFARMAGRLIAAKAALPSEAMKGLIPLRMEAPE